MEMRITRCIMKIVLNFLGYYKCLNKKLPKKKSAVFLLGTYFSIIVFVKIFSFVIDITINIANIDVAVEPRAKTFGSFSC